MSRVPGPGSRVPALQSGFTLLEVLAALAVLAIAFAIGLGALGKSAQNAVQSAALDTAVERAQSVLAEQGLLAPLKDETLTGKFDDGMRWTLKIHALPSPAAGNGEGVALRQQGALLAQAGAIDLYQLDIGVQYGAGRTLRLSTQRAQAAPPGSNGE
ncbi:MAG: prepilin-type N-terminal cleavage/methylation domain-containing protein [Rhodanobacteraceae bacterium]